jgi:hypothetical protein
MSACFVYMGFSDEIWAGPNMRCVDILVKCASAVLMFISGIKKIYLEVLP